MEDKPMAILQVRDIDDRIYEDLKRISQKNRRSISQEVIHIIETYLSNPDLTARNSTEEFLNLSGSWKDRRSPERIIDEIRKSRSGSRRFKAENGIFD